MKKIEIKVEINCEICKTEVMKAVTELTGIDQISLDVEKGILTVLGVVDPVCVVKKLEYDDDSCCIFECLKEKKPKRWVKIISVGPPKPPEPPKKEPCPPCPKKGPCPPCPEKGPCPPCPEKGPCPPCPLPPMCKNCEIISVTTVNSIRGCSIV